MSNIQAKTMINEFVARAPKCKKQLLVNLNEVEEKMATTAVKKSTLSAEQFMERVNAVKNGELAVPSPETLRAYAGIDEPMLDRFRRVEFPRPKI